MLVTRYRIVYVGVPSGYPGVETIDLPTIYGKTKEEEMELLRKAVRNRRNYAILYILEAK